MRPQTELTAFADIKRMTLELINRQSIAGAAVSPEYNNQSDITGRIPNLINAALSQIALAVSPAWEALPGRLTPGAADTDELDAPFPWVQAACYYAAAYLVADENEFLYAALMNEYETFLNRLKGQCHAEFREIPDAYGGGPAQWLM